VSLPLVCFNRVGLKSNNYVCGMTDQMSVLNILRNLEPIYIYASLPDETNEVSHNTIKQIKSSKQIYILKY